MQQVSNLMTYSEYADLASLRGAKLQMFGGRGLHEWFSGSEVNLVTSQASLHIWAQIDELDRWEGAAGGEPDYSTINVAKSDEGLAEAQSRGLVYFFHRDETITDVFIVRETVTHTALPTAFGAETWDYVTDVSIVLVLSEGALAVTKTNHSVEDLVVTHADSLPALVIPRTDGFWYHWHNITYSFESSRKWLTIEEAVETQAAGDVPW